MDNDEFVALYKAHTDYGIPTKDCNLFYRRFGRLPTQEECKNGLKTIAEPQKLTITREYWTALDGYAGRYEISNWGAN